MGDCESLSSGRASFSHLGGEASRTSEVAEPPRDSLALKAGRPAWGTNGAGPGPPVAPVSPCPAGLLSSWLCNLAMNRSRCGVWCQRDQTCLLRVTAPSGILGGEGAQLRGQVADPEAGRSKLVA